MPLLTMNRDLLYTTYLVILAYACQQQKKRFLLRNSIWALAMYAFSGAIRGASLLL